MFATGFIYISSLDIWIIVGHILPKTLVVWIWPSWAAEFSVLTHAVEIIASLLQYQAYRTVTVSFVLLVWYQAYCTLNCIRHTLFCNSIIHCTASTFHCTVIVSCILYSYIIRNTLYCYCIRYVTVSLSDIHVSSSNKCLF